MPTTVDPPSLWFLALLATLVPTQNSCAGSRSASGSPDQGSEMTHQHHTIDYIELAAVDLADAKRFYGAAFGWAFNDYGPDYAGIQKIGGGEVGGIRREAKVVRGGPLVILYSSDLEVSVRAVQDAGGRIVKEPFSFPGGRRFHFTDPAGNELAVWSEQ